MTHDPYDGRGSGPRAYERGYTDGFAAGKLLTDRIRAEAWVEGYHVGAEDQHRLDPTPNPYVVR